MSIIVIILTIFGHYPFSQPDIDTEPIHFVLFISFGRILWTAAVGYIIFACHHGYGGFVNMILSLSFWQPLSKLTYAIYITHNFVILMTMATERFPLHFSRVSVVKSRIWVKYSFFVFDISIFNQNSQFYWLVCNYGLSVMVGLVFFLLFESPIYALEPYILRILLPQKREPKQQDRTTTRE